MVRAQAALGRGDPLLRRGRLTTPTHLRASVREEQTGNGERRAALRFSWRPGGGRGVRQTGSGKKREPTNTGTCKRRSTQTPEQTNAGTDKRRNRQTPEQTRAEHAKPGSRQMRSTQTPEQTRAKHAKPGSRQTPEQTNAGADKRRSGQTPGACKRREHAGIAAPAKNRGKKLAVRPFFVSLFTEQTNKKFFSL